MTTPGTLREQIEQLPRYRVLPSGAWIVDPKGPMVVLSDVLAVLAERPALVEIIVNGQPVQVPAGPIRAAIADAIQVAGQIGAPIDQWVLRTRNGEVIPHQLPDGSDFALVGGQRFFLHLGLPVTERPAETTYPCGCERHYCSTHRPSYLPEPERLADLPTGTDWTPFVPADAYCRQCGNLIPCGRHPDERRGDEALPIDVRRELMACARDCSVSYYWLVDVYRRGQQSAERGRKHV